MIFAPSDAENEKLQKWLEEMHSKFGEKYYGAIGGAITYSFTPTGLGVVFTAKHVDGGEIDLTEYGDW